MTNYLKTTEIATSENYPYGRLKCTKTWAIEFSKSKGFRVVEQTTNPKTGRLNAPKKSTYSTVAVLTDTDGFIRSAGFHDFNGTEEMNKGCKWMAEHFDLFTPEQIEFIYFHICGMLKVEIHAICTYCGADPEKVKPYVLPLLKIALHGVKTGENVFSHIQYDIQGLDSCKVPDFKPFRISQTYIIDGGGMRPVQL